MIRKIAATSLALFLATQVIADLRMVKSPQKIEPRTVPIQKPAGGVAGFDCGTAYCCDYCWVGTSFENNCDPAWQFDNDCDCGCQFDDPRCPLCDYCWSGGTCPAEWQYDLDCDCGCQWPDCGCTGFGECATDADCPSDPANCLEGFCDWGDPDNCLDDVCDTRITVGAVCRPAVAGGCDMDEICDPAGNCPADSIQPAGTVCRPVAGDCDVPEECDGISADCPTDVLEPDTTVCGPAPCSTLCSGYDPECPITTCNRVSISKKGSLLYYSKIELRWNATAPFAPRQDTFLTVVNDYSEEVCVQWYFINGDDPTAAVYAGSPPVRVERAHGGCNQVNCTTELSANKTTYMSALTGDPLGCQPFSILDPDTPPGRPDPENPGQRILRGYAIAFAVDCISGAEISWNHLSGHVDIVNYANRSAWEYNTYAFQCVADPTVGNLCGADPGTLHMDGSEYDYAFNKLLFDFYAVGSFAFSMIPTAIQLDTDLTLHPVSVDLRTDDTDSDGPVLTRAKFDIWNQNEDARSGVNRCITCWDQALLSNYAVPNNFLIGNLQTNKGKARIDGIESDDCDAPGACCCTSHELNNKLCDDPDCDMVDYARGTPDRDCSEDAALLGVSDKILFFSGAGVPAGTRTDAGMTLVGQGIQEAVIKRDLVDPPDPLTNGLQVPDAEKTTGIDEASLTPVREQNRGRRRIPYDKK